MKKILYVENEPDQVALVRTRLEASGYEFIWAEDGETGIKKALVERPDLIILDIFLPGIKGLEVCKQLKQNAATKGIPIIVLTGSGVEYVDKQSKTAGADACIKKPYDGAELLAKIKLLLGEIK